MNTQKPNTTTTLNNRTNPEIKHTNTHKTKHTKPNAKNKKTKSYPEIKHTNPHK